MSAHDYTRIDEVYHNMYKNKFHREEPLVQEDKNCGEGCDDCEDCRQDKSSTPEQKRMKDKYLSSAAGEAAEEELGPDPKEIAEYDKAKADISFDKYSFWDAYHAVKEGAWSEDDFHQWCQTVWNDGANEGNRRPHGSEDAEHVFTPTYKAAKKAGYSERAAEKIAGAAKAKANK